MVIASIVDQKEVEVEVTVAAEATTATITHNLGQVPVSYSITPTSKIGGLFIDNETTTSSRLNLNEAQPSAVTLKCRVWK